jgi:hypothetical protein
MQIEAKAEGKKEVILALFDEVHAMEEKSPGNYCHD